MKKETIDINKLPKKPLWYLRIVIIVGSFFMTLFKKIKVNKVNCENLKWPYLLVCSHASFYDFALNAKMTFPHHTSYICSIEEFVGREWLMRGIGAFPKRKYTQDIRVVKHSLHVLKRQKNTLTIYPEARYTPSGTNERIDGAMGKLAKTAKVPVVVMLTHGNFLQEPQWDQGHLRNLKHEIDFICVATKEEVETLSAEEIQERIEKVFVYDDYKWQFDNKIAVKSKYRANNIHNLLYKCPHCGSEEHMDSKGTKVFCSKCNHSWNLNEDGTLTCLEGETRFTSVTDWFEWEREEVRKELINGTYSYFDEVDVFSLPRTHRFFNLGKAKVRHTLEEGFVIEGNYRDQDYKITRTPVQLEALHVEYDYFRIRRDDCFVINTEDDSYFCYPRKKNIISKLAFATEEMFLLTKNK